MRVSRSAVWLAATALGVCASGVRGQGAVTVHLGGATSLPGADAVGDPALYGVGGLAVDWLGERTRFVASVYGGLAADAMTGADFGSVSGSAEAWTGPGTALGVSGRGSAFRIQDPFTYRSRSVRAGPAVRLRTGPVTIVARGEFGAGSTLVEVARLDGRVRRAERDLWTRGFDLEASTRGPRWSVGLAGGRWTSSGGSFARGRALARWVARRVAVQVEGGTWSTPIGSEWVGALTLVVPFGGRGTVAATMGRAAPDPLTLVEAGGQGGIIVGWDLGTFGGPPPEIAELSWDGESATLRLRLDEASLRGAVTVDVIGDFTEWSAVPLRRDGATWVGEIQVAPGVHHFGFLVDGEWFVPTGRSGNVPDEWGRMNATLVVAEQEGGNGP